MVDLNKKISLHKSTAVDELSKRNLEKNSAHVAVILDVSKSMHSLYHSGVIQNTLEQLLGLALSLDIDGELDGYVFGTGASRLFPLTIDSVGGYVQREIILKHKINQATNYGEGIRLVNDQYFSSKEPVFVIFITDGDAGDKPKAKAWLKQLSRSPFFFQFIGIGKEKFSFLERLVDLGKEVHANTGFVKANDISSLNDTELYTAVLSDYPKWHSKALSKGIISVCESS